MRAIHDIKKTQTGFSWLRKGYDFMKENDEMKKNVEDLKKIANEPAARRKSLLTPNERSVVFGILFAVFAGLFTLSLDLISVPENESVLWLLMFFLYVLLIVATIFIERFLVKKFCVRRTLYYAVAHVVLLIAIITLIVMGVRHPESVYEVSTEFSYALALGFTQAALLLYHLGRVTVLAILRNSKSKTKQGNKRKK